MKISFIGGGNMAAALIAGLAGLAGKVAQAADSHVVDPNADALARLRETYGMTTSPGIRGADLSRWLGGYGAIVRTMRNTPALIGQGITGMVAMAGVGAAQKDAADSIMRAVGQTVWLDEESLIDPVTAVSRSGPAYVFYFLEAMQPAAAEMGLSAEQGKALALATFTGAAQLAAQEDEPVDVLRQRVMSKGGTSDRWPGCRCRRRNRPAFDQNPASRLNSPMALRTYRRPGGTHRPEMTTLPRQVCRDAAASDVIGFRVTRYTGRSGKNSPCFSRATRLPPKIVASSGSGKTLLASESMPTTSSGITGPPGLSA
jgi:pyrroline-5-carboxylate reductase